MICPTCGNSNRPGARFCAHCGAALPTEPEIRRPPSDAAPPLQQTPAPSSYSQPSPLRPSTSFSDPAALTRQASIFGGHSLVTLGALIVLFGFMLPWASCGSIRLSGLDIAMGASRYTEEVDTSGWYFLMLLPMSALGLMASGLAGIGFNLVRKSLSDLPARLITFLPLIATLPGLCGCLPSGAFFYNVQKARSDPYMFGLGTLIQIEYGFWLSLFGLGMSFFGIIVTMVGGLLSLRQDRQSGAR